MRVYMLFIMYIFHYYFDISSYILHIFLYIYFIKKEEIFLFCDFFKFNNFFKIFLQIFHFKTFTQHTILLKIFTC